MRDRHLPRLCSSCHAPVARQEDSCWRCGTRWASQDRPATILRLAVPPVLTIVAADIVDAPGAAGLDVDRWVSDGGTNPDRDGAVVTARADGRR